MRDPLWLATGTGSYGTRAELFTVLEVMQARIDPAVYAQCQAPSVTWGLLDRAQQVFGVLSRE